MASSRYLDHRYYACRHVSESIVPRKFEVTIAVGGDFEQGLGSADMKKENFVEIPILLGKNTDEDTSAATQK